MSDQKPTDPKSPGPAPGSPSSDQSQGPSHLRQRVYSSPDLTRSRPGDLQHDLTERKRDLIAAFDRVVEPLKEILRLLLDHGSMMRRAQMGVAIAIMFILVVMAAALHVSLRLVALENKLDEVVSAQARLQQTATQTATKVDNAERSAATMSQISIEPPATDSGAPVIVVRPPPTEHVSPIVIPIAPPPAVRRKRKSQDPDAAASADAPPAPPPAEIKFESAP